MKKYFLIAGLLASTQVQALDLNQLASDWLSKPQAKTQQQEEEPPSNKEEENTQDIGMHESIIPSGVEPLGDSRGISVSEEEISKWSEININSEDDIQRWKFVGVTDPKEAKAWKDESPNYLDNRLWGTPQHLKLRNQYNVKNANDVHALAKKLAPWVENGESFSFGRTTSIMEQWNKIGVTSVEKKLQWEENGFRYNSSNNPEWWIRNGVTDPLVAKVYDDFEIRPQEISKIKINDILEWKKIGVKSMSSLNGWSKIGLDTPQKVAPWLKTVGDKPQSVEFIIQAGFTTPEAYAPYSKIKFVEHLKILNELKIKPTPLIETMSKHNTIWNENLFFSSKESFVQAHNTLKGQCNQIENDFFTKFDAYSNKGKCYIFSGTMYQRLSANTGLVREYGDRYMFATFNGDWIDNKSKIGVVKGEGAFSYTTTNGKANVVPKGKAIFLK